MRWPFRRIGRAERVCLDLRARIDRLDATLEEVSRRLGGAERSLADKPERKPPAAPAAPLVPRAWPGYLRGVVGVDEADIGRFEVDERTGHVRVVRVGSAS